MYYTVICIYQDVGRVDLSPYKYQDVNITSFRLVDPDKPKAREYLKDWTYSPENKGIFARGRAHPLFVRE